MGKTLRFFSILCIVLLLHVQWISAMDFTPAGSGAATHSKPVMPVQSPAPKPSSIAIPLYFEPNLGQSSNDVQFVGRSHNAFLLLTRSGVILSASSTSRVGQQVQMQFAGTRNNAGWQGIDRLSGKSNCFIGSDPKTWMSDVPHFAKARYSNAYAGIDAVFYSSNGKFEYDFELAPHARPNDIQLAFSGTESLHVDRGGDLILHTSAGDIRQERPHIYQKENDRDRPVQGRYIITGPRTVGFQLRSYNPQLALVIDPAINYSTFLGGNGNDSAKAIALDATGNIYVAGSTGSTNFPKVMPFRSSLSGTQDAFVAKFAPGGSTLLYSTYLGGNGSDTAYGIAVDSTGAIYLCGSTGSTNFPKVKAIQGTFRGGIADAWVAKLSPQGNSLVYSTYLGGTQLDIANDITVDSMDRTYVVGQTSSTNFKIKNAQQTKFGGGTGDGFLTIFNPSGGLTSSTYVGGNGLDVLSAVEVSGPNIFVVGTTSSNNLPVTTSPTQGKPQDTSLVRAFFLIYVAFGLKAVLSFLESYPSLTQANDFHFSHFPTSPPESDRFDMVGTDPGDARLLVLNDSGKVVVSKIFRGAGFESIKSVAVDSTGAVYLAGNTSSTNFPLKNAFQKKFGGGAQDGFVMKLAPKTYAAVWSSYLGGSGIDTVNGIAVDAQGNAYVVGSTDSHNFKVSSNGYQKANAGGTDAFITRIK